MANYLNAYNLHKIELHGDYKTRFSNLQAKLALSQLNNLEEIIRKRKEHDNLYNELLSKVKGISLPEVVDYPYSHYTVKIKNRDAINFREKMYKLGIECGRTLDYCLPDMPLYSEYNQTGSCPNATIASEEIVNLPNYPSITTNDIQYISECVKKVMNNS